MFFSADISLLITLVGIILIIPISLLSSEDKSPLVKWTKGIDRDLMKRNETLLTKARKYSHEKKVTGKKLKIRRQLGAFPEEKAIPRFIVAIACLSLISIAYCFICVIASYIYSVSNNISIIDCILITGQVSVIIGGLGYWYGRTFEIGYPTLYRGFFFILWLCGMILSIIAAFTGIFFHCIDFAYLKWFYHGTLIILLAPVLLVIIELINYYFHERKKYSRLNEAVMDFEKFKKETAHGAK